MHPEAIIKEISFTVDNPIAFLNSFPLIPQFTFLASTVLSLKLFSRILSLSNLQTFASPSVLITWHDPSVCAPKTFPATTLHKPIPDLTQQLF